MLTDIHSCSENEMIESHTEITTGFGIDIISTIFLSTARVSATHKIGRKWSVAFESGINFGLLTRGPDEIELKHRNALNYISEMTDESQDMKINFQDLSASLGYWPTAVFEGPCIYFGGRIRDLNELDMTIGIGYTFDIIKRVKVTLAYHLGINESIITKRISNDGIRLSINYLF